MHWGPCGAARTGSHARGRRLSRPALTRGGDVGGVGDEAVRTAGEGLGSLVEAAGVHLGEGVGLRGVDYRGWIERRSEWISARSAAAHTQVEGGRDAVHLSQHACCIYLRSLCCTHRHTTPQRT